LVISIGLTDTLRLKVNLRPGQVLGQASVHARQAYLDRVTDPTRSGHHVIGYRAQLDVPRSGTAVAPPDAP